MRSFGTRAPPRPPPAAAVVAVAAALHLHTHARPGIILSPSLGYLRLPSELLTSCYWEIIYPIGSIIVFSKAGKLLSEHLSGQGTHTLSPLLLLEYLRYSQCRG